MIGSLMSRMGDAQKLSIPQLQRAIQDGVLPAYVGIPLLQEKMQAQKQAQAAMAMQSQQQQAPIAQQVMQEAQAETGLNQLPSNLPQEYAHGGIVAFAGGGDIEDYLDQNNEDDWARIASTNATNEADLIDMIANSGGRPVYKPTGSKEESRGIPTGGIAEIISGAAKKYGLPAELLHRIAGSESGNNPNVTNKTGSSAKGLFQFLDSTWEGMGGKAGEQFNPEANADLGGKYIRQNAEYLKKSLGRNPSYGDVYAAHFFGPKGAAALLSEDRSEPIEAGLASYNSPAMVKKIMEQNPNLKGKSVGQVLSMLEKKTGEGIVSLAKGGEVHHFKVGGDTPEISDEEFDAAQKRWEDSQALKDNDYMKRVEAVRNLPSTISDNMSLKGIGNLARKLNPVTNLGDKLAEWGQTPVGEQRKIWEAGKEARESFGNKNQPKPWTGPSGEDLSMFYNQDVAKTSPASPVAPNATPGKTNTPEGSSNDKAANDIVNAEKIASGEVQAAPSYLTLLQQRLIDDMAEAREQGNMNKYLALMQAGFAMMGGTSPYAMTNIGQGAASGVSAFANLQKATNEDLRKLRSQEIGLANIQEKAKAASEAAKRQEALLNKRLGISTSQHEEVMASKNRALDLEEKKFDEGVLTRMMDNARNQAIKAITLKQKGEIALDDPKTVQEIDDLTRQYLMNNKTFLNKYKKVNEEEYTGASGWKLIK